MMREVRLGAVTVLRVSAVYLETRFAGGLVAPAYLVVDTQALTSAMELGYVSVFRGDSRTEVVRMHVEHELAHTFLSQRLYGLPHSPTLLHVAGGPKAADADRAAEEATVWSFQRQANIMRRAGMSGGMLTEFATLVEQLGS